MCVVETQREIKYTPYIVRYRPYTRELKLLRGGGGGELVSFQYLHFPILFEFIDYPLEFLTSLVRLIFLYWTGYPNPPCQS